MSRYRTESLFGQGRDEQAVCNHIIRVAFEAGVDASFDYFVPDKLWPVRPGQRVEVPFGRGDKLQTGFCAAADVSPEQSFISRGRGRKLKRVRQVIDKEPLIDAQLMALAEWISNYYVCPLGQVLAAMVPSAVKKGIGVRTKKYIYLAEDIGAAVKQLRGKKQKQVVEFLEENRALSSKDGIELGKLLTKVGCTDAVLKKLAEKQVIKFARRTVLKALPAIPEGMAIRAGEVILNDEQRQALAQINAGIDSGRFGVTLLYGVTDSGKTELYIRAIASVLEKGKAAIVMLPEIALTTQTIQRFSARFERIAVMHSQLSASARNAQWQKIKAGEADVVIGARSAVFAPASKLGLIVVDEEHEPSYKQDTAPRYNGRDVAIKRAQLANAHCILGSATPSLESMFNCRSRKHFSLVRLRRRVMDLPMPQMNLVDLAGSGFGADGIGMISRPLQEKLSEVLARGEQAILLLNRRGYSNFVFCSSCNYTLRCRNCDVTLTFHRARLPAQAGTLGGIETIAGRHLTGGYAVCHYCLAQTLVPERCPFCRKKMVLLGLGSQRLEEELAKKFPDARVARVDSDSMQAADYYRVLDDFSNGRIDILAGTQMLAKGLHFPNVTLVGIISADTSLAIPDFRANERTFQLISQVAGRAGRSEKKGVVFVQTFLPEQPAIRYAARCDYKGFVAAELQHREECNLPPFWRLALIVMRDEKFDRLTAACCAMREKVDGIVARGRMQVTVRGPMPAAISRIQRFHRMQIIIQAPEADVLQHFFGHLRASGPVRPEVKVAVDIDPVNLL